MVALPGMALADVLLATNSATVSISPDTQAGVYDWTVSGQNHLNREWWWVQVGGDRFSLDALTLSGSSMLAVNRAITTYTDAVNGYSISITYELTGSDFASGNSLLKESLSIQNTSGSPLDISLFMYSDFNMGGTATGDSASLFGLNDSHFIFGDTMGWFEAGQSDGSDIHHAIYNGKPLLAEIGSASDLFNKLDTTLDPLSSDVTAELPLTSGSTNLVEFGPFATNDVAYAIQWDFNIGAYGSDGLGVDKSLQVVPIPEPTTAALCLLGLAALAGMLRGQKDFS